MKSDKKQEIMDALSKTLTNLKYSPKPIDERGLSFLRFETQLGDRCGAALIELCLIDFDGEFELVQIYTTLLTDVGDAMPDLARACLRWNLKAPLGAYGVHESLRQMYHKYNIAIDSELTCDDICSAVFRSLYICTNCMQAIRERAALIASGAVTFDDAVQRGWC